MHGFVKSVMKLDVEPEAGHAADARVLGTFAHAALERFFTERRDLGVPVARMTSEDRARLLALIDEEAQPLLAGRATGHLPAIEAAVAFLRTALVRAVSILSRAPPVRGVEPWEFEVRIGAADRSGLPPRYTSVPVRLGAQTIHIGGIIDRVDEGEGGRVVVDYKTAGASSVREKARPEKLFESHFQLPLYLRLLEHHRPTRPDHPMHGYLVSVREGVVSDDIGKVDDLRARVLDDDREDGLAAGLARVLLPVLDGTLVPDVGTRCDSCRLQRVCRVPLAGELAPDLDLVGDDP
jgi:ATP-dependent helicase/DNAse subunit B